MTSGSTCGSTNNSFSMEKPYGKVSYVGIVTTTKASAVLNVQKHSTQLPCSEHALTSIVFSAIPWGVKARALSNPVLLPAGVFPPNQYVSLVYWRENWLR